MKVKVKDHTVLIDEEDLGLFSKSRWCVTKTQGAGERMYHYVHTNYVDPNDGADRKLYLHRAIMGVGFRNPQQVDHKNGDGLDNRKQNLRLCTEQENNMNRRMNRNNTSGYKGVSFDRGRWQASIGFRGKSINIGRYPTKEQAWEARKKKEEELFGEFANNG